MLDESFVGESEGSWLGKGVRTNQVLYRGSFSDENGLRPDRHRYYFCSTDFEIASTYAERYLYLYRTDRSMRMADLRDPETFLRAGYPEPVAEYLTETEQNMPAIMLEAEGCFEDMSGPEAFSELSELGGFDFRKWGGADRAAFEEWIRGVISRTERGSVDPLGLVIDDVCAASAGKINVLQDSKIGDVILMDQSVMPAISTGIRLTPPQVRAFRDGYGPVIGSGDADAILAAASRVMRG